MRRLVIRLIFSLLVVAVPLVAVFATDTKPQLGLDLQGGISVVLAPKAGSGSSSDTLAQAVEIIRNRVDSLGVAEPEINRQGNNIIIDLPGVKDRDRALQIVGQTAELRFRTVLQALPAENVAVTTTTTIAPPETTTTTAAGGSTTTTTAATTSTTVQRGEVAQETTTTTAPGATTTTTVPPTTTTTVAPLTGVVKTTEDILDQEVVLPVNDNLEDQGAERLRLSPTIMTGKDVKTARAAFESGQGWVVHLEFTGDGFKKFQELARQNYQKQVAIVLDGVVQSYPVIQDPNFDINDVVISGNFKEGEARDLARVLKYGALPVPLERQTVQDVSPTLGKEQLRSGIIAGLLGLAFVAVYMVVYYRLLGVVIITGLLVVAGILYSITSWLGSAVGLTLTLSGVTGIIVSVGTTVDSYVVYFERLKDEVRSGKTIRSSLDRGFSRSFRTIMAGNLVSLIGASLLYFLAIGSVRGFAFFLGVTTLLDIFVAYFFMHPVVSIIGRRETFQKARWLGIASGLKVKGAPA
ncbi:MAG TPA: protein translocase subunit SecD [Acidimicrobiia bacterium]|nr:protein translocase subunit SecD [Acidimicrobiia bacterium]